jgi:hypothetical protein
MNDQPVDGRDASCLRSSQRSTHHARAIERRMKANGSLWAIRPHLGIEQLYVLLPKFDV